MEFGTILVGIILVNNYVLAQFLGICPFLGVSKKLDSAVGMGVAVIFVIMGASIITYFLYHGVLVTLGIEYMQLITFILVIASFVQFTEMASNAGIKQLKYRLLTDNRIYPNHRCFSTVRRNGIKEIYPSSTQVLRCILTTNHN